VQIRDHRVPQLAVKHGDGSQRHRLRGRGSVGPQHRHFVVSENARQTDLEANWHFWQLPYCERPVQRTMDCAAFGNPFQISERGTINPKELVLKAVAIRAVDYAEATA
jgi:hypothetical protein